MSTESLNPITLLPCPFCGGEAKYLERDMGVGLQVSRVKCTKCHAELARCDLMAKAEWNTRTQSSEIPLKKPLFSCISEEYIYAKSNLEDKLVEFGMTDWDELWTDPYVNSIELGSVDPDNRLSPEAQKYLREEQGFSQCWLNHKDGMETAYYKLQGEDGSRRPSAPHRLARLKQPEPVVSAQQPVDCREAFERWGESLGLSLRKNPFDGNYDLLHHRDYWKGWQAAWQSRPSVNMEELKKVREALPQRYGCILKGSKSIPLEINRGYNMRLVGSVYETQDGIREEIPMTDKITDAKYKAGYDAGCAETGAACTKAALESINKREAVLAKNPTDSNVEKSGGEK